jgi:hypothetical protein
MPDAIKIDAYQQIFINILFSSLDSAKMKFQELFQTYIMTY